MFSSLSWPEVVVAIPKRLQLRTDRGKMVRHSPALSTDATDRPNTFSSAGLIAPLGRLWIDQLNPVANWNIGLGRQMCEAPNVSGGDDIWPVCLQARELVVE